MKTYLWVLTYRLREWKAQMQEHLSFLIYFSHLKNKANFKEMKTLLPYEDL